jgi:hypothetical protein
MKNGNERPLVGDTVLSADHAEVADKILKKGQLVNPIRPIREICGEKSCTRNRLYLRPTT